MIEVALPVVGNLLGGLFANRSAKKAAAQQRAWALEDQQQQWVRHREASELGGFNPLATMGMGQGVAPTPIDTTNYMGSAIADSALLVADAIAAKKADQTAKKAQDLAATNAKLNSQVRDLTLRPKIGGVYAQRQSSPTLRQALGAENATSGESGSDLSDSSDATRDPDGPIGGVPELTAFGRDWTGSGAFSKAQTVEDAIGDGIGSMPINAASMTDMFLYTWGKDLGVVKAPYGQKPGKPIPEVEVRKPFPRKGSEDAFNYHMGRHRPQPAWMRGQ